MGNRTLRHSPSTPIPPHRRRLAALAMPWCFRLQLLEFLGRIIQLIVEAGDLVVEAFLIEGFCFIGCFLFEVPELARGSRKGADGGGGGAETWLERLWSGEVLWSAAEGCRDGRLG